MKHLNQYFLSMLFHLQNQTFSTFTNNAKKSLFILKNKKFLMETLCNKLKILFLCFQKYSHETFFLLKNIVSFK